MKAIQHIKIERRNIEKLKALDCIRKIEEDKTGNITCYLHPESTCGLPIAKEGEYLVQFETNMWQCFGAIAYLALVSNPSEERRRY